MVSTGKQQGFSLIELMMVMAIMVVILNIGIPSFASFRDSKGLVAATEQVYSALQQGRSESIARDRVINTNFSADGGTNWSLGLSHNNLCDLSKTNPTDSNACVMVVDDGDGSIDPGDGTVDGGDLVLRRLSSADHADVRMAISSFSSGNSQIQFDPMRGTATAGDITLTSAEGRQLKVRVGLLGQIRICEPSASAQPVYFYNSTDC